MTVTHLEGKGFRNLLDFSLSFGQGVNILYGDNAQGKTNLLEALWMFTGSRSFRGAKDAELIRFEEKKASLTLRFKAQGRDQEAQLQMGDGKQALLNGVGPSPVSVLNGQFCAVVFAPGHLSLVKEGPEGRRRFLDQAICQVWPKYASLLGEYHRCLHQRNMLLKDVAFHSQLLDTLDIWEHFLSSYGGQICSIRMRYLERLAPTAAALYGEMSGDKEALHIAYHSKAQGVPWDKSIEEALKQSRKDDIAAGYTTVGPHRDDLKLLLDGKPAKNYGSQGQQRSIVLSLKMAEADVLKGITGEQPVLLLDDVMSELDPRRQDTILNHAGAGQVFVTCCDPAPVVRLTEGEVFEVSGGMVRPGLFKEE